MAGSAGGLLLIAAVVYAALVVALVVRARTADAPTPVPLAPAPGEPLWATRVHHRLFALILLGAPLERLALGGASGGKALGAVVFAAGVALYRSAGRALGSALSPFITPREGASLVTRGLYRHLRHPIYLGEAMIAVGAPLVLGCRWVLALSVAALAVLALRMAFEEKALARTFPDYPRYAAATKRLVPFVY